MYSQSFWSGTSCLIVLEKGEELITNLRGFAVQNSVNRAFFQGIGATNRVRMGVYSEALGSYMTTEYRLHLEISSLTGNIFLHENKPFIHAHGVFSGTAGMSFGGHIEECEVSPTCEIYLTKMPDVTAIRTGTLPLPRLNAPQPPVQLPLPPPIQPVAAPSTRPKK